MIEKDEITAVGKFLKTHALKGELNVVFDIEADDIDPDAPLIVDMDGIYVPFYIDSMRPKGQFASLLKLDGINSEIDAKPFVNKTIYLLKKDIPEYDTDEQGGFADDFIGYTIIDTEYGVIGEIENIDMSTQNMLFIVNSPNNGEIYIPISEEFILSIDNDKHEIVTTLPQGLLDINKKNN